MCGMTAAGLGSFCAGTFSSLGVPACGNIAAAAEASPKRPRQMSACAWTRAFLLSRALTKTSFFRPFNSPVRSVSARRANSATSALSASLSKSACAFTPLSCLRVKMAATRPASGTALSAARAFSLAVRAVLGPRRSSSNWACRFCCWLGPMSRSKRAVSSILVTSGNGSGLKPSGTTCTTKPTLGPLYENLPPCQLATYMRPLASTSMSVGRGMVRKVS